MNVVDLLKTALKDRDWSAVEEAYQMLGGSRDDLRQLVNNTDADDARLLAAVYHDNGETPPKRKRGRPKKIKAEPIADHKKETTIFNEDFTITRAPSNSRADGQKIPARMEEFRPPTGPNLFDPSIPISDDPSMSNVNDKVKPVPRVRKAATTQVPVFCSSCNKTIMIHPMFKKEPYICDYAKLKKPCPYAQ